MTEVSPTRLYLGNLPRNVTKQEVEQHFKEHGTGEIVEIKLMQGFGFIEYKDPLDARDVVPALHGSDFMGERLTVQFARGSRPREAYPHSERTAPRPRRTQFRMTITGLPAETSWQDLKDFARQSGLDVVYSETGHDRDGRGFVEYETATDLKAAVDKLDGRDFKGAVVKCIADIQEERPRDRFRSRSPPSRRGPQFDDYDRRGPPRGYGSPGYRRDYRDRSPPRGYYDSRYRSPPRARYPAEDYPPPRRPYPDDGYDARPPRRGYEPPEPYLNGGGRPYDRPPSPRRPRSPGRGYGGGGGYDRRPYW